MKVWALALLVGAVLIGCGPAPDDPAVASESAPSPLASTDKSRLWILTQASPIGDGRKCSDYYRAQDDPRSKPLKQECEQWSLDYTDYLRLNGFPTLEPAHVREVVYWDWFDGMRQTISACMERVNARAIAPRDGEARRQKNYDFDACDPYRHETRNNNKSADDLGIVRS